MNINPKQMKFSIRKISMLVAIATLPVSLGAQEIPVYFTDLRARGNP